MQAIQASQSGAAQTTDFSFACNGDLGEEVAVVSIETGEAERTAAHQERDAEEAAQVRDDAAQVQAMHDEASSLRAQGVFDAATAVAGACLAIACPPAASGAQTLQGLVGSHLTDGVGKLGDALWQASQHDDEANAAAARAAADQSGNGVKDATDAANEADSVIGAALDFDRNYTSIEAQTQLAALHRA
jgi:hypothetical protein